MWDRYPTNQTRCRDRNAERGIYSAGMCREQDDTISDARAAFDWEKQFALALDPEWAKTLRQQALDESSAPNQHGSEYCTMCGPDFCSVRLSARLKQETL